MYKEKPSVLSRWKITRLILKQPTLSKDIVGKNTINLWSQYRIGV